MAICNLQHYQNSMLELLARAINLNIQKDQKLVKLDHFL